MFVLRFERRDISRHLLRFLEAENAGHVSAVEFEVAKELKGMPAGVKLLRFDDQMMFVTGPGEDLIRMFPMAHVIKVRIETAPADQLQ
ncbi:MAG: hypothetical protein GX030_09265 [Firmicutes bacterium]|nr:hypothetical protein [Bacillota bacterium]